MVESNLGTIKIANNDVELMANSYGKWQLYFEDEKIGSGDTLEQAKSQAQTYFTKRKVKVAIPFFTLDGKKGICTGIHGRTSNLLVEIDRQKQQLRHYSARGFFAGDTPKEKMDRYNELSDTIAALERERSNILREHSIDLSAAIRKEIGKAIEANREGAKA